MDARRMLEEAQSRAKSTKKVSFMVRDSTKALIDQIAKEAGLSKSEVVQICVRATAKELGYNVEDSKR